MAEVAILGWWASAEGWRTRHDAKRTVATYEQWLRRFLRFHGRRHPREMGSGEVNAFLTHLAVDLQVSTSAQNQVLSALLFLYRELLDGVEALVAGVLYGGGLRQGRLKVCLRRSWQVCQHWVWSAGFLPSNGRNPLCCSRSSWFG